MNKEKKSESIFSVKKTLLFLLGALALYFLVYKAADRAYSKNQFRFENFKRLEASTGDYDKDNARKMKRIVDYLQKRFPVGYDVEPLLRKLEEGGARCGVIEGKYYKDYRINNNPPKNAKKAWFCEYFTGWFALDSIKYRVVTDIDINNKILLIEGFRVGPK